jgi:hypothetical protein
VNIVIGQSITVFERLVIKNETLFIGRNAFLVMNLGLDVLNRVVGLDVERKRFVRAHLDVNLSTYTGTTATQDEFQGGLVRNIVIGQSMTVFELLFSKNEKLLIWRNAFLVFNLGLDALNGVGGLDVERQSIATERLDENLSTK